MSRILDAKRDIDRIHSLETQLATRERELAEARAEADRLRNNTNRFPELMARVRSDKSQQLQPRIDLVLSAIAAMPEGFGNYQWETDERQLFGEKWVRSVAGNNGNGMGRQAIAAVPNHLTGVAPYIAAANPDTVLLLIVELAGAEAERDRLAADNARKDEALQNALAAGLPEVVARSVRAALAGKE